MTTLNLLVFFAITAVWFLAHDMKEAIRGRWSLFKYGWVLSRSKVIAERKVGNRTLRVIRLPKGAIRPAPGYFRKGTA